MERFVKGDVVVIPFPFTDLSTSKKRPAIILADIKGDYYFHTTDYLQKYKGYLCYTTFRH